MEITASGRCSTSQPTQPLMKLFLCAPSLCSSEFGTHVTAHSAKPPMTWECLIFPGTYDVEKKHYTPDSGAPQCTWEKFSLLSLVSNQQVARSSVVDVIPAAKLLQLHRFQQEKKLPLTGSLNQIFNAFRAAGFPYWAEDQFVAAEPYIWFLNVVSAWDTAPAIWDFLLDHSQHCSRGAQETSKGETLCGLTPAKLRAAPKITEWGKEEQFLPAFMDLCCPHELATKPASFKLVPIYAARFAMWTHVRAAVHLHCASSSVLGQLAPSDQDLRSAFIDWACDTAVRTLLHSSALLYLSVVDPRSPRGVV